MTPHHTAKIRGITQQDAVRLARRRAEARRLSDAGMSNAEIAARLGASSWTIAADLRRFSAPEIGAAMTATPEAAPEVEYNDEDIDAEACRRLWGSVLVVSICDAMAVHDPREEASGATKLDREQAVAFIGSRVFHMACAFAGLDGEAAEARIRKALNGTEAERMRVLHRLTRGELYFGTSNAPRRKTQDTGSMVAEMMAAGLSAQEIADRVGRAPKTITAHMRQISRKRAVKARAPL